jgi:LysR family tcuABC transcriptional regulator
VQAAQSQRLSGAVSVGLAPTTAAVLGLPLMQAMRERYPGVRLHLVESLSGHLATMLDARRLDFAVVFNADAARRWQVQPLLREKLFVLAAPALSPALPRGKSLRLSQLAELPLLLPSEAHGLRATVDAAFAAAGVQPRVVAEIDSSPAPPPSGSPAANPADAGSRQRRQR